MIERPTCGTTVMGSGDYTFRARNDVVDKLIASPVTPPFYVVRNQASYECRGDGSVFCCARNGCHPICGCVV